MPSPHPFSFRTLWLIGLVLLIPCLVAVCLLWIVFERPVWIESFPETDSRLVHRTVERLYRMRLQLPSRDADGNGTPDWFEGVRGVNPGTTGYGFTIVSAPNRFIYTGERTRLRLVLNVSERFRDVRWPNGTTVTMTAAGPILLPAESPEGTPPTAGPLLVKVSPQGRINFDVLCLEEQDTAWIRVVHARSGVKFKGSDLPMFSVSGWRLPARPSRTEMRTLDANSFQALLGRSRPLPSEPPRPNVPRLHLTWEPLPGQNAEYILEAARADAPEEWIGFWAATAYDPPSIPLGNWDRRIFPDYDGTLLYRVIPAVKEKPPGR